MHTSTDYILTGHLHDLHGNSFITMQTVTLYAFLAGILFTGAQSLSYLEAHNNYRKTEESVPLMRYDNAIAQNAANYARRCIWGHSTKSDRQKTPGFSYLGENLFLKWGSQSVTADEVVTSWYNEKSYYNRNDLSCQPGKMCGHYTQVMWSKSTALGCATQKCASMNVNGQTITNALLVVCQYGPGGNYVGESPFQRRSLRRGSSATMALVREIAHQVQSGAEGSEEIAEEIVGEPASPPQEARALDFTMVL